MRYIVRAFALVWLFCALVTGCAQQRSPINRVQANALAKSFFVGDLVDPADDPEFYMRVSVVDVMYGANSDGLITSTDGQPLTRVRWEITEKNLLARLTYELVKDSDHKGARLTADGQIVAAFDIVKHFDVRNDYNPSTGEEYNVVVENDSDRPWYQRGYFRVDWSKNLITDAYSLDTLSQTGIEYGVKWDPVAYYVGDPSHPDSPVFDVESGYFDITTKALATPRVFEGDFGSFPACLLLGGTPDTSCNPTEVKLRNSFMRVQNHDYEPIDWDGARMDIVGVFSQDRYGYDRGYGIVDEKWHRFAARWNLFARSHTEVPCATKATTPFGLDANRDVSPKDGTADECKDAGRLVGGDTERRLGGSHCDVFAHLCTIPLRDRVIKTIPWYVNSDFAPELFDATRETLEAWNNAVRVSVLSGRVAECRRVGEQGCEATMGWPKSWSDDYVPPVGDDAPFKVANVFALCHNPVQGGDSPACGPVGLAPRLGDLRFNFINIINAPQSQSPWGIMVDSEDPLTGEKISGSVNMWGARTDHASATLVDLVMLLNGLLDPTNYIQGKNVAQWVEELQKGGVAAQAGQALTPEELDRGLAAFDPKVLASYLGNSTKVEENPHLRHKNRAKALIDSGRLGPGNTVLAQRLRQLQGSAVEARMISPEMTQLAGYDPSAAPTAAAIKRASPFGWKNPAMRRAARQRALIERAHRGSCRIEAADPDNITGLAFAAAKLFGKPNAADAKAVQDWRLKVYEWARIQYSKGVLAHELGHSMGLRHNFAASFDSLNYDVEYWQLRSKNGTVTKDCPAGTTDGSQCIGPRWRDPITQEELDNNIGFYATTSVMDYPGETAQDQRLLGKYDRSAMRFIYGGTVDVWAEPGLSVNATGQSKAKAYRLTAFASSPGLTGIYYFPVANAKTGAPSNEFIHYSQYQNELKLLANCQASQAADAVLGQKCTEAPLDVVDYRDMSPFVKDKKYAIFSWGRTEGTVDPAGRVRRGYLFMGDEFADAGNVTTFTNDAGADAYEIVRFLASQYQLRYVLDGFRRNRTGYGSDAVTARMQAHYFDPIESIAKTFSFGALLDGDPTAPTAALLADGNYGPLALASSQALDLFAQIMTRPEPGYYCSSDVTTCAFVSQHYGLDGELFGADSDSLPASNNYNFHIALGDGRFVHNDFDYTQGYWWNDYQTQTGAYYEKVWAMYYLSEAFDNFISNSKEDFVDSRYKNVNFATVYPDQVRRLYNNLLTDDLDVYAPRVKGLATAKKNAPLGSLLFPTWTDRTGLGTFPKGAQMVEPNWGWNERIYAMVWGSMYFATNWSYDWLHQARIAVLPTDQPAWPEDEIYAFFYPKNGMTYRAHSNGSEKLLGLTRQKSAGARMLEWANKLLTLAYAVKLDANNEPIRDQYGRPILVLDKQGHAKIVDVGAAAALQSYVDQIDMFRQITTAFAQPTDDLPKP